MELAEEWSNCFLEAVEKESAFGEVKKLKD